MGTIRLCKITCMNIHCLFLVHSYMGNFHSNTNQILICTLRRIKIMGSGKIIPNLLSDDMSEI